MVRPAGHGRPERAFARGHGRPLPAIDDEEAQHEHDADNSRSVAPQVPDRGGGGGAATGAAALGFPMVVKAQGPIIDALAEHVAGQGHLPRVRQRLRQEGQRHDRRRPQDRGAAGRRGGAGLRPARRGVEGHARRRPRRARVPLRQADGAGALGLGPGLRHGRQHAAVLAQVRRRQAAPRQALRVDQRQRRVVPLRPDADPAARLVQEAGHQARRLQGAEVPHGRHLDRRVHGPGRRRERAARRRDRAGHGPRPARRRRVQQRHLRPHPRLRRRLQGLHAAELSTRTPSSSRSRSTRRSTTRCRTR